MANTKFVLRNIDGKSISLNSNEKIEFEDDNSNLNPAKHTLINRINKIDKNLSVQDFNNMSVSELLTLLAANNIEFDDFFDDLDDNDKRFFKAMIMTTLVMMIN